MRKPHLPALRIHANEALLAAIPIAEMWQCTKELTDSIGIWQNITSTEQVQLQDLVELHAYTSVIPLRPILATHLVDAFEVYKTLHPIADPIIDIAYVYDRGIGIESSFKILGMNGTYKTPQGLLMRLASNKQTCAIVDTLIKKYNCFAKEPESSQ